MAPIVQISNGNRWVSPGLFSLSLLRVNERKLSSDRKSSVLKFTENGERAKASPEVEGPEVKGSLTRDFRSQFFFINQCPPGPQVFQWGRFVFFRKFAEIFAN
jgi:hypothetical protein